MLLREWIFVSYFLNETIHSRYIHFISISVDEIVNYRRINAINYDHAKMAARAKELRSDINVPVLYIIKELIANKGNKLETKLISKETVILNLTETY